jgi:HEAT repeat protein
VLVLCTGFEWPGRLARLEYDLSHAPPPVRRDAVKRLGFYTAEEVREPLLAALEDDDVQVRKAAAASIGRVQLKQAAPLLAAWLADRDGEVRVAAVNALGALAEPSSREALTRALSDALPAVRREAAGALARIADDEAMLALQTTLSDADPTVREAAVLALRGHADGRVLPALSSRLQDESPAVRAAVLSTLGSLSDPRALPLLARATDSEHDDLEIEALRALGELGARVSTEAPQLLATLRKKLTAEPRVAKTAIASIGRVESPAAFGVLVDALSNPDLAVAAESALVERVRRTAGAKDAGDAHAQLSAALARALETAKSPEQVTLIADLIVSVADVMPTASLSPAVVAALERGQGDPRKLSQALAATASPDALVPLLERLSRVGAPESSAAQPGATAPSQPGTLVGTDALWTSPNPSVLSKTNESAAAPPRRGAAPKTHAELDSLLDALLQYASSAASDGRAADPLIPQLSAAVPAPTRVKIIRLLGWSGAARALPSLQRELASPQLDVQLAAADAIGRIGSADGLAAIQPLLDSARAEVRLGAARAYGALAREAEVNALLARLEGKSASDRTALLTAAGIGLGRLRAAHSVSPATTKAALQTLGRFVTNPDLEVSATALDALRRFGDDGATSIVARELLSPKQSRRVIATFALADFPGDETRRLLRFVLQRSAPRAGLAALLALGEVGDQRDITAVQRIARFAHWPLPAAATFALRRIAGRAEIKKRALERSLCELGHLRDPYARANIASSLAALGGNGCSEFDVRAWYAASEPSVVRAAAARFLRARAEQLDVNEPELLQLLATCSSDPDPVVRAACAPTRTADAEASRPIEIVAYDADGQTPLRQRLIALRFADASAFVGYTDANARVLLQHAPAGPVVLENPGE